jgi:hypothetical protein
VSLGSPERRLGISAVLVIGGAVHLIEEGDQAVGSVEGRLCRRLQLGSDSGGISRRAGRRGKV